MISPPPVVDDGGDHLPAYVSNGVIGLRVAPNPLRAGVAMLNGLAAIHPVLGIEESPQAPYPLAGDVAVDGVVLSRHPEAARGIEQRYDFACGELHTTFHAELAGVRVHLEIVTLASRTDPSIVLQEVNAAVDRRCSLVLTATVSIDGVPGTIASRMATIEGGDDAAADGCLRFDPPGGLSEGGVGYATELLGATSVQRATADWQGAGDLSTSYRFDAEPGVRYRLRQAASMVPSTSHRLPDLQAARLAGAALHIGFDEIRRRNGEAWELLWRSRVVLCGAEARWQAMSDAAFYYLHSSVHPSSRASTSIFGLARWHDYHYYYGHVMWDIEAFSIPPLLLTQPDAATAILDFRARTAAAAHLHARMHGRTGLQYPWESGPSMGHEAAPAGGLATVYEDHVSLVIAQAFAQYVYATGDERFAHESAWPVVAGVADWVVSRVRCDGRGAEIRQALGIAERPSPDDNNAYVNMGAAAALRHAIALAEQLGHRPPSAWRDITEHLVLPIGDDDVILDHDGFDPDEDKAATPAALAGLTLFGHPVSPDVEAATLRYYLGRADEYVGSPMLSSLLGLWATQLGDRRLAADLFEEGYAKFCDERFHDVHEYRPDKFPEQPVAGPFYANLSGFLLACLYGLPRIRLGRGEPATWCKRGPLVMPEGWDGIEVDRVWVRGRPHRLLAEHGADRAELVPDDA